MSSPRRALLNLFLSALAFFGACRPKAPTPTTVKSALPGLRVLGPVVYQGHYEVSFTGTRASVTASILLPDGQEHKETWTAEGREAGVTGVLFDGRDLFPVPRKLVAEAPASLEISASPPAYSRVSTSLPRPGAADVFLASSLGQLTASLWLVGAEGEISFLDGALLAVPIDAPPALEPALGALIEALSRSLGPLSTPTLFVLQGKASPSLPEGASSPGRDWEVFVSGEEGMPRLARAMTTAWLGPEAPEELVGYFSALLLFRASLLPPDALPVRFGPSLPRAQLRLFCYDAQLRRASPPGFLEGTLREAREKNIPLEDALAKESFFRSCYKKPWQKGAPAAGLSSGKKSPPVIEDPKALRSFLQKPPPAP